MKYKSGINWNLFLNEVDLLHNDKPVYLKNFVPNYQNLLSWGDVESSLNNYQSEWEIINNRGHKVDIPLVKNQWSPPYQNKNFIHKHIQNGSTFTLSKYSVYNNYTKTLGSEIEDVFKVSSEMFVFGSKKESSPSFKPHYDEPSNFIIQIEGNTKWIVYSNTISELISNPPIPPDFQKLSPLIETTLQPGDFLYIPSRCFHVAIPQSPRLSISIPCKPGTHGRIDKTIYKL